MAVIALAEDELGVGNAEAVRDLGAARALDAIGPQHPRTVLPRLERSLARMARCEGGPADASPASGWRAESGRTAR